MSRNIMRDYERKAILNIEKISPWYSPLNVKTCPHTELFHRAGYFEYFFIIQSFGRLS